MLEVCFNDSLGSKLMRLNYKKETQNLQSGNVLPLQLYLNLGDLSEGIFSDTRKKYVSDIFTDPWMGGECLLSDDFWDNAQKAVDTILDKNNSGEKIRFWVTGLSNDICTFLYLISLFNDVSNVSVIYYPDYLTLYRADTDKLMEFECLETPLTNDIKKVISPLWNSISSDKHLLRAVINCKPVGVDEAFYDSMILAQIPSYEFNALGLIDRFMKAYSTHVDDFLIKRMCLILRNGNYDCWWKDVVQSPLDFYEQMYCKK